MARGDLMITDKGILVVWITLIFRHTPESYTVRLQGTAIRAEKGARAKVGIQGRKQ